MSFNLDFVGNISVILGLSLQANRTKLTSKVAANKIKLDSRKASALLDFYTRVNCSVDSLFIAKK